MAPRASQPQQAQKLSAAASSKTALNASQNHLLAAEYLFFFVVVVANCCLQCQPVSLSVTSPYAAFSEPTHYNCSLRSPEGAPPYTTSAVSSKRLNLK